MIFVDDYKRNLCYSKYMINKKELIQTIPKGIAMGIADVIPGVSGGTLALLLGIYERFINALKGLGPELLSELNNAVIHFFRLRKSISPERKVNSRHLNFTDVLKKYDCFFLGYILLGIAFAIAIASKIIPWLMIHYTPETLSLFIGLILPSISVPYNAIKAGKRRYKYTNKTKPDGILIIPGMIGITIAVSCSLIMQKYGTILGTNFDFKISAIIVFISAMIAICAMMLPGISGSYLLLLMGQYFFVLGIVGRLLNDLLGHHPSVHSDALLLVSRFSTIEVFALACCFASGAIIGLLVFSRVINWSLQQYHNITMAGLTGMVIGSLYVLWPFKVMPTKEKLDSLHITINEKVKWLPMAGNKLPEFHQITIPIICCLIGIVISWKLIQIGKKNT